MLETVIQFFTSAAFGAIAGAALIWFARTWISEELKRAIKSEYDQKLETHKAQLKAQSDVELEKLRSQLKAQSDVEIEKLRSQLQLEAKRNEVRFSRLHGKRADVIAETYSFLKELYFKLGDYVKAFEPAGGPSRKERYDALVKAHQDFYASYARRLVFFPKATADQLDAINLALVKAGNEFHLFVDSRSDPDTKRWIAISDRVETDIRVALTDLEGNFRRLLGDEE